MLCELHGTAAATTLHRDSGAGKARNLSERWTPNLLIQKVVQLNHERFDPKDMIYRVSQAWLGCLENKEAVQSISEVLLQFFRAALNCIWLEVIGSQDFCQRDVNRSSCLHHFMIYSVYSVFIWLSSRSSWCRSIRTWRCRYDS